MELSIPYSSIEDVNIISRWDAGQKFCIRITVPDGSVLLQVGSKAREPHRLHCATAANFKHSANFSRESLFVYFARNAQEMNE